MCLTKYHAKKSYWWVGVKLQVFVTSELDGGEWSDSRPGRYTQGSIG
jgi:hypothetical protein